MIFLRPLMIFCFHKCLSMILFLSSFTSLDLSVSLLPLFPKFGFFFVFIYLSFELHVHFIVDLFFPIVSKKLWWTWIISLLYFFETIILEVDHQQMQFSQMKFLRAILGHTLMEKKSTSIKYNRFKQQYRLLQWVQLF